MKRRAAAALAVVTAVFLATLAGEGTAVEYVRATAEAAMVGGLADWFAVTALFRRPLGLPIPHTAVIPERKDQFGRTLGEFVHQNFLSPETIGERVRASQVTDRLATWLTAPGTAEAVAHRVADAVAWAATEVGDDEVHDAIEEAVRQRLEAVPLAPLAGRVLGAVTAGQRHHELLEAAIAAVGHALDEHREALRDAFHRDAPWWLPGVLDDRIFDGLVDRARALLGQVAADPEHELRRELDRRLHDLIGRLATDPGLRERGEQLKAELLASPEVRNWSGSLWSEAKAGLRAQADDPESPLRRQVAAAVEGIGRRLRDDDALRARVEEVAESGARYVADRVHGDLSDLVTATVSRWDGVETSDKLELLLGRDLQFIRINGTVVGGLAGLAIHAVAEAVA